MKRFLHVLSAAVPVLAIGLAAPFHVAVAAPGGKARIQDGAGQQQGLRAKAPPAQPRLILVLVVDGLPNEQVLRYRDQFGQGGLRRLLDQGAWFSNAHQAHGITVTAAGHAAILTGTYPYQHGIIGNGWLDARGAWVYCTEDRAHRYLGEVTHPNDGTSPANLRVSTLGDELRYAHGGQSKVLAISGKDRGAILLAGKSGTAYMYMDESGRFASSSYYMAEHPEWVRRYHAGRPEQRYYGQTWTPLLAAGAYAGDTAPAQPLRKADEAKAADARVLDTIVKGAPVESKAGALQAAPKATEAAAGAPFLLRFGGPSAAGQPGAPAADPTFFDKLRTSPFLDELTLAFARAALDGEQLGRNPAGVPDLLGISLSAHDYINHAHGPESVLSHDHLQRLDRLLAEFFADLDKRIGMDKVLVVLTADHGFANRVEFSQQRGMPAQRIDFDKLMAGLRDHTLATLGHQGLVRKSSLPNVYLDYALAEQHGIGREQLEQATTRWLLAQPGIAHVYTRSQLETGRTADHRTGLLMRRSWHPALSGDLLVVPQAFSHFGATAVATHGTPYAYDTNVPLILMGKPWIRPGSYGQYAEVVDLAPTLAHLLRVRPPAGAEGRVLTEALR